MMLATEKHPSTRIFILKQKLSSLIFVKFLWEFDFKVIQKKVENYINLNLFSRTKSCQDLNSITGRILSRVLKFSIHKIKLLTRV